MEKEYWRQKPTYFGRCRKYIEDKMLPHFEQHGFGNYIVVLKSTQAPIGNCGMYVRPNLPDADIGYALITAYEGRGYAVEAARCLLQAAKEIFHLPHLYGYTSDHNKPSQNVLLKLGMEKDGTAVFEGETEELIRFKIDLNGH